MNRKEKRMRRKGYKKATKKEKKEEKRARLTMGQKIRKICLKVLIAILMLLLLAGGVTGALVYFDVFDVPFIEDVFVFCGIKKDGKEQENISQSDATEEAVSAENDGSRQYSVEHPDADAYYRENSEVLSETKASEADTCLSEKDAYNFFAERGFDQYPITTSYAIDGEYIESVEITQSSSDKHPMYETIYMTENGDVWSITIVNATITAYPVTYNIQENKEIHVMLSEADNMMCYDSEQDKFYHTVPHDDVLILKTIEKISADVLEQLTFGDIDGL